MHWDNHETVLRGSMISDNFLAWNPEISLEILHCLAKLGLQYCGQAENKIHHNTHMPSLTSLKKMVLHTNCALCSISLMVMPMADVLTLGQHQLTVLHYQVQQRSVALPSNNLSKLGQPTFDSALKWGKESLLLLLSLLY